MENVAHAGDYLNHCQHCSSTRLTNGSWGLVWLHSLTRRPSLHLWLSDGKLLQSAYGAALLRKDLSVR